MNPQPLIAIWTQHPHDLLGAAIDFVTHGDAQHAGFLRSDGVTIHECYLPKVRNRPVLADEKQYIRLFQLEGMTEEAADKLETFFDLSAELAASSYSIAGLFGYLFNVVPPNENSVFCSQYVMQTLRRRTPDLMPLLRCNNYQVSPRDLLISPRLYEVTWADLAPARRAEAAGSPPKTEVMG